MKALERITVLNQECFSVIRKIKEQLSQSSQIISWTFPHLEPFVTTNEEYILRQVIPRELIDLVGTSIDISNFSEEIGQVFSENTCPSYSQMVKVAFTNSLLPIIRFSNTPAGGQEGDLAKVCAEYLVTDPREIIVEIFESTVLDLFFEIGSELQDWTEILAVRERQLSFQSTVMPKLFRMGSSEMIADIQRVQDDRLFSLACNRWTQETANHITEFLRNGHGMDIQPLVDRASSLETRVGKSVATKLTQEALVLAYREHVRSLPSISLKERERFSNELDLISKQLPSVCSEEITVAILSERNHRFIS